jgi:hypothetical protein
VVSTQEPHDRRDHAALPVVERAVAIAIVFIAVLSCDASRAAHDQRGCQMMWVLFGVVALGVLAFALLGRTRGIAGGRLGRLARLSRLSARLSASWLGSRVRRLFAGRDRRKQLDASARRAAAERVAKEMGEMKGAMMKLG